MNKKIIITGTSGYVGKNLSLLLKKKKFVIKKIKTTNIKKFRNINSKYDTFIHLGFDLGRNCNVNYQKNIIKDVLYISKKNCKNLIFLSTSVIGPKNNRKIILNNNYQKAKYNCEKILNKQKNNLEITILRVFNIIGPNQKNGYLLPDLISKFSLSENINLKNYLNKRDFIHIDDVCSAIYFLLKKKKNMSGIFEIGSGQSISILEVAKIIKSTLRSKNKIIKNSLSSSIPIKTKAILNYKQFKWKPKIKIKSAIKNIVKYEKKNWNNLRKI